MDVRVERGSDRITARLAHEPLHRVQPREGDADDTAVVRDPEYQRPAAGVREGREFVRQSIAPGLPDRSSRKAHLLEFQGVLLAKANPAGELGFVHDADWERSPIMAFPRPAGRNLHAHLLAALGSAGQLPRKCSSVRRGPLGAPTFRPVALKMRPRPRTGTVRSAGLQTGIAANGRETPSRHAHP